MVRDTGKETLDGAWKAAQDTANKAKDAVMGNQEEKKKKGPNNYDHFEDETSFEELRRKAGGYDK